MNLKIKKPINENQFWESFNKSIMLVRPKCGSHGTIAKPRTKFRSLSNIVKNYKYPYGV